MLKLLIILIAGTAACIAADKLFERKPNYEDFPPEYFGDDALGRHHSSRKLTKKELAELERRQAKYTRKERDRYNRERVVNLDDE